MNDKFDGLAKSMAQAVTRRGALKKFGVGLAGIALAMLGSATRAHAAPKPFHCHCKQTDYGCAGSVDFGACTLYCSSVCSPF